MTLGDVDILGQPEIQSIIEQHLHLSPEKVAFSLSNTSLPASLIATQVKYLQKSRLKCPSYYNSRCIIPPVSFEQSSSEETALLKATSGNRVLDLTCGLGIDTFALSKSFHEVQTIEASEVLYTVAQHNFNRLGIENVSIVHAKAEDFIANYRKAPFDVIYVDPDRRDPQGNKLASLVQSSPNIISLLPALQQITPQLIVKLSPLFDPHALPTIFPDLTRSVTVSVNRECKELLAFLSFDNHQIDAHLSLHKEVWIRLHQHTYTYTFEWEKPESSAPDTLGDSNIILEPDVAFYQSHTTQALFDKYFPSLKGAMNHPNGYFFSSDVPTTPFPGRVFEIKEVLSFSPKKINQYLKAHQIHQLNITKRFFPFSIKDIRKQLHIKDGGEEFLICSLDGSKTKKAWLANRIS